MRRKGMDGDEDVADRLDVKVEELRVGHAAGMHGALGAELSGECTEDCRLTGRKRGRIGLGK